MKRTEKKAVAIIPARYGSTRFPGKSLALISGKPMVQWVCEGACTARTLSEVWVATDDDRIEEVCNRIAIPVFRSRQEHHSGTDRIIEASHSIQADIVVNIQGDEPLISGEVIDAAVKPLLEDIPPAPVVTLIKRIERTDDVLDPNIVKVVVNTNGNALYFSRCPIPALFREGCIQDPKEVELAMALGYYKHIGLYAYQREFLALFSRLSPSGLEKLEQLEQLRVLENGHAIHCVVTEATTIGVDQPSDIMKVEDYLATNPSAH